MSTNLTLGMMDNFSFFLNNLDRHFVKAIKVRIFKAAKLKSCTTLLSWQTSIINMVWYALANSGKLFHLGSFFKESLYFCFCCSFAQLIIYFLFHSRYWWESSKYDWVNSLSCGQHTWLPPTDALSSLLTCQSGTKTVDKLL